MEEAKAIAKEGGETLLAFGENTPLIGHALATGYAIAGDKDRAEQVKVTSSN